MFHIAPHTGVKFGDSGEGAADLEIQIPAAKCLAVPVVVPHLVGDCAADIHLPFAVVVVPVFAGVVKSEIKPHSVAVGERKE